MNDITIKAKIYMKSGIIMDESVVVENTAEEVKELIEEYKNFFKQAFKENTNGQFTFGFTIFRFSEIAAIKFYTE